jgi:hypothetical protein
MTRVAFTFLVLLAACEPSRSTEQPGGVRLSGPDDADAEYPPGCSELGPSACSGPCQRGDAAACLHLAEGYREGVGVPRDPQRAVHFMRKSCELKLGRGCAYLAMAIGRRDRQASRALATDGCNLGYGGACVWLVAHHIVDGAQPRWNEAAPWLQRGCASEHGNACLLWGDLLRTGIGTTKDTVAAKVAYRTACDAGEDAACELAETQPTDAVVHILRAYDPDVDELRRTRQHGRFEITLQVCVLSDGTTRVEAMQGATGTLADVVRNTVAGWRWAPTGATEPVCEQMKMIVELA